MVVAPLDKGVGANNSQTIENKGRGEKGRLGVKKSFEKKLADKSDTLT